MRIALVILGGAVLGTAAWVAMTRTDPGRRAVAELRERAADVERAVRVGYRARVEELESAIREGELPGEARRAIA